MVAEGAGFNIQENSKIDTAVLLMNGYIDANTVPLFEQYLAEIKQKERKNIVLDFSGITHLSSQGVSVLVQNAIEINESGKKLQTVGLNKRVKLILDELKLTKFFV